LNHEKLAADARFTAIAGELSALSQIEPRASFNRYCLEAWRLWNEHFGDGIGKTSALFSALLDRVDKGGGGGNQNALGPCGHRIARTPRRSKNT
jgi:hypothetical protein